MGKIMSSFGEDLVRSPGEALAHSRGEGSAILHPCVDPRQVREKADITQAQMATLMGMSLSGYREWEQGRRRFGGPVGALLQVNGERARGRQARPAAFVTRAMRR